MESQYAGLMISGIVAICTGVYTFINYKMLRESKRSREQKLDPIVVPYLQVSETRSILEFRIKNIGEGLARDVKINVLEDFERLNKESLTFSNIGAIKNGVSVFPPQYELKYYIGRIPNLFQEHSEKKVKISFTYQSIDGRNFHYTYELPFNQIFGQNTSTPPDSYLGQIPYYLNAVKSEISVLRKSLMGDRRSVRGDETYLE